eukprot:COSAG02_NODE_886_length_16174_cov_15.983765_4_plen_90_part_00
MPTVNHSASMSSLSKSGSAIGFMKRVELPSSDSVEPGGNLLLDSPPSAPCDQLIDSAGGESLRSTQMDSSCRINAAGVSCWTQGRTTSA